MKQNWQQNVALTSIKFVAIDLIGDLLYWPVWWFTAGAAKWAIFCLGKIKEAENYLGLRIWIANITTPMFAQYDWQGRLISFFIRLVIIIFKIVIFVIWVLIILISFLAWFILPIYIVYQIWFNLNHLIIL